MLVGDDNAVDHETGILISHAWKYKADYEGVVNLLNADPTFRWKNFSVPIDDPIEQSAAFPRSIGAIVDELRSRIAQSDCLLVTAGMYCHYRQWIQTEIEAAQKFGKPIIKIRPTFIDRGSH